MDQVAHVVRLVNLGAAARAVAGAEFSTDPDIQAMRFRVTRAEAGEDAAIDVEYLGARGALIGGMSL